MKTKRRTFKIFAAAFVALFALCCLLGFAACGDETSVTGQDGELEETKTKLEETEAELADTKSELEDTKSELDKTKSELEDAKAGLEEAEAKIEELESSNGSSSENPSTHSSSGDLSYATYYDGSGYMVTGIGEWTDPDLVIPAEHNGVPVVEIAPYAFYLYNFLTSVTIPESVEVIGDYAFYECGLTEIHYNAVNAHRSYYGNPPYSSYDSGRGFDNAGTEGKDLTLTIGSNVESIPEIMFRYSYITSVIFEGDSQCTSIGDEAFAYCSSLTSVTIPGSVESIGNHAFSGCTSLTAVYYGGTADEWTALQSNIGSDNTALTSATIYYYSETEPTDSGNWWHYVDGEIVVWGSQS